MARNKTPLRETEEVDNITETEENLETTDFDLETADLLDDPDFQTLESQYMGGLDTSTDTSDIDKRIAQLDAPKSASIWDKQAAMYRQQGEGAVLRTQKNLTNLFGPTLKVIAAKEKVYEAKFNTLKSTMKEFDDSKIFGQLNNSEIDIATEAKNISKTVKEDMRKLSRMNINHADYDELRKKIESDQGKLANYDLINKTLLEIRNSGIESKDWSKGMTPEETAMWRDIFTSNGKNISIEDGKMYWQGEAIVSYEFGKEFDDDEKFKALGGRGTTLGNLAFFSRDVETGEQYTGTDIVGIYGQGGGRFQKHLKELYPDHEFGNDKWGPKTQAAYDMYLRDKDKLEKEWLDKNYKGEFRKTTTVDRIELNAENIGAGPKLLSSKATVGHKTVSSAVIEWKNKGGELGEMYEFHMGSAIQDYLDELDEGDVKSLIFDGFGDSKPDGIRSPRKAYSGFNTEDFMMDILKGTYGEDMDEAQIESYVNKMRSGSMYDMYTLNGEEDTLKNHFDNWYREEQKKWFEKDTSGVPVEENKGKGGKGSDYVEISEEEAFDDGEEGDDDVVTASSVLDKYDNFNGLTKKGWVPPNDPEGRSLKSSNTILNYGDDAFVIGTLNREYGDAGFTFTHIWGDKIQVTYKDGTKSKIYDFDQLFNKKDNENAGRIRKWMMGKIKNDPEFGESDAQKLINKYTTK
jgi:hypothetical protein